MSKGRQNGTERIGGVALARAGKVWWPRERITKGDVARFYADCWERIRPWMRERLLTAERCPDGMRGRCFIQKDFPRGDLPAGAPRQAIRAASTGKLVHYLVGGTLSTLVGMVDLGAIAIHGMNSRRRTMHQADWLAFDLDPASGDFADAARAAVALRRVLDEIRVTSYPKTSGARGLHVLIPLRSGYDQHEVRTVAAAIASEPASREPRMVTTVHAKRGRRRRVYLDVGRNSFAQTIALPYSVRRRPKAPVSAPLEWDEVRPSLDPAKWNVRTFRRRIRAADPWAGFWRHRQALPDL